jgi:hypothetical protein
MRPANQNTAFCILFGVAGVNFNAGAPRNPVKHQNFVVELSAKFPT